MMLLPDDRDIWIPNQVLKPPWYGNKNELQTELLYRSCRDMICRYSVRCFGQPFCIGNNLRRQVCKLQLPSMLAIFSVKHAALREWPRPADSGMGHPWKFRARINVFSRHVPRICPRGVGAEIWGGPRLTPLQNQKLFGFGHYFLEGPILRTKKKI